MRALKYFPLLVFTSLLYTCTSAQSVSSMEASPTPQLLALNDSLSIAYTDQGKGNHTLIFVHGLGSNHKAWQKNVTELSKDYRCISLDLPGYGQSSKGSYPFGMAFFADQIDAFIKALGIKKATLIGHSMGGQIAITLALRQPGYLTSLVLAAPAGLETFSESDRSFFATYVTPDIIRATPKSQIEQNFAINFFDMPEDARFMVEDRFALREDSAAYTYYSRMIPRCVSGMLTEPVAEQLPSLRTPTLLIFGQEDQLIPNRFLHPELSVTKVAESGQQAIPNSQLIYLQQAGHFVQWDQAKDFNLAVKSFLK
jgi:pimeloyl-ACP methyl ester carboxylesterase